MTATNEPGNTEAIVAAGPRWFTAWLTLAGVLVAFDQYTKAYVVSALAYGEQVDVLPFLKWVRWHNDGAAFSFLKQAGGWQLWLFIALAIGFSAYLLYELWRLRRNELLQGLAYACVLGGAIGNLIDRASQGYVVDFVLLYSDPYYFPAFNVADSAIFCGAVLWGLLIWREYKADRTDETDKTGKTGKVNRAGGTEKA